VATCKSKTRIYAYVDFTVDFDKVLCKTWRFLDAEISKQISMEC